MKAIVKKEPGIGAVFMDMPMPKIQPDEMLVKVLATGICGSDRDIYEWRESKHGLPLPVIMGHELFGEVVEVGPMVQGYEVGDMISSDSHMPCGQCYLCRTGNPHLCMKRGILGHEKDGCFAEYLALPAVAAFKMPKDTKPEFGALMEPMGVVYHAASRTPLSGKRVLILGLGALGYMMLDAAKNLGASRVIVCSTNDEKLAKCKAEGADFVINSKKEDVAAKVMEYTDGVGADVVFEMSGAQQLFNLGLDSAAYGGKMVVVGVPNGDVVIPNFWGRVAKKEVTIITTFGREFYETWELMRDLLATGRLDPSKYVGGILPIEKFEEGFELAKKAMGRVILIP